MPKRITVTALKPVQYDGRSHARGAVFTTTPVDAASLKYRGFVKLGGQLSGGTVPENPSIQRRMEPVKAFQPEPPATPAPADSTPEPPPEPSPDASSDSTPAPSRGRRGGRTYQRRDMQAERADSGE